MKLRITSNIMYILKDIYKTDKTLIFYLIFFTILTSIAPLIEIIFPKIILDQLIISKDLTKIIIIVVVFCILNSFIKYLIQRITGQYSARLIKIRLEYVNKLQEKCMEIDYENTESPDVLDEIQNAWNAVQNNHQGIEGIMNKLFKLFGILLSMIACSFIIFTLNPLILIFLIASIFILYLKNNKVKNFELEKRKEMAEYERKYSYTFETMSDFTYGKDIRIFKMNKFLLNKLNDFAKEKLNKLKEVNDKNFGVKLLDSFLTLIRNGIVYIYLVYKVLYKNLGIGSFTMYFSTIVQFTSSLQDVLYLLSEIKAENIYLQNYRLFIDKYNPKDGNEELDISENYKIEFENVSFKYPNTDKYILKNFSLVINKGEKLALIGLNGAGKTTLIKLLTRLYEPDNGVIKLNGIDISKYKKQEYNKIFSIVLQDINVVAASIAENIALKNDISGVKSEILKTISEVGLNKKISNLDKGINTQMLKIFSEDGTEFSGGEKQKLALARALFKNGGIYVLDEPTSALDPIAEYRIYSKFNKIIKNKTAIYVSHRLSSTKFCDNIILIEDGEIKEYGNHGELIRQNGRYKELFDLQAQYYKDTERIVSNV